MARGDEPVYDRIYDIAMRGKKFPAGGGNLDADLVVRRDERRPCLCNIGLSRDCENESIDHGVHDGGIRVVVIDCRGIARSVNDRRSRGRPGVLCQSGSAAQKEDCKSNRQTNQRTV